MIPRNSRGSSSGGRVGRSRSRMPFCRHIMQKGRNIHVFLMCFPFVTVVFMFLVVSCVNSNIHERIDEQEHISISTDQFKKTSKAQGRCVSRSVIKWATHTTTATLASHTFKKVILSPIFIISEQTYRQTSWNQSYREMNNKK